MNVSHNQSASVHQGIQSPPPNALDKSHGSFNDHMSDFIDELSLDDQVLAINQMEKNKLLELTQMMRLLVNGASHLSDAIHQKINDLLRIIRRQKKPALAQHLRELLTELNPPLTDLDRIIRQLNALSSPESTGG